MLLKLNEHFRKTQALNLAYAHKGIVRENDDSQSKSGLKLRRIKCWIETIMEDNEKLIWCYPKQGTGLGGSPDLSGFTVPEVGAEVEITFPLRDIYHPEYGGAWQSENTHQHLYGDITGDINIDGEDFSENYPNDYGWIDSQVMWLRVKKIEQMMEFFHQMEALIQLTGDGDLRIRVPNNMILDIVGDVQLNFEKDLLVNIGNDAWFNVGRDITIQSGRGFYAQANNDMELSAKEGKFVADSGDWMALLHRGEGCLIAGEGDLSVKVDGDFGVDCNNNNIKCQANLKHTAVKIDHNQAAPLPDPTGDENTDGLDGAMGVLNDTVFPGLSEVVDTLVAYVQGLAEKASKIKILGKAKKDGNIQKTEG